jgi:SAM-dependent methyltransferase
VSATVSFKRHPLVKSAQKVQKKFRKRIHKSATGTQKRLRRWARAALESGYYRYNVWRWYWQGRLTLGKSDSTFNVYLREQLKETLLKRRLFDRARGDVVPLVDMLASRYDFTNQSVLCVGCRNDTEIRYFRSRGAGHVVGIDLYQAGADILIMDMHDLKFGDSTVDVVYSRHSFEHSYDTRKAAMEFVRVVKAGGVVVIEVPGRHKGGGDYNYFTSLEDVLEPFSPHVGELIWKEYSVKEQNTFGFDIIRLMFHVAK